jgi:Fe-S-cluster containining protein
MRNFMLAAYNPPLPRNLHGAMKNGKVIPIKPKLKYSCAKCPAYCCSYPEIEVTPRDIERLAKHFSLPYKTAEQRLTKYDAKEKVQLLRHQKDRVFDSVCALLDQKTRQCTVYEARPAVCRGYPESTRCGYYDFLKFERAHQDDPKFIALT